VFGLAGQLTVTCLTLDFVWLLYMSFDSQMNKEEKWSDGVGYVIS